MEIDLLSILATNDETKQQILRLKDGFDECKIKVKKENVFVELKEEEIFHLNEGELEFKLKEVYEQKKRHTSITSLSKKIIDNLKEIYYTQEESLQKLKMLDKLERLLLRRIEENVLKYKNDLILLTENVQRQTQRIESVDLEQIDDNIELEKKDYSSSKKEIIVEVQPKEGFNPKSNKMDEWDDIDNDRFTSNPRKASPPLIDMEISDDKLMLNVSNFSDGEECEENYNLMFDEERYGSENDEIVHSSGLGKGSGSSRYEGREKKPISSLDKRIGELKKKQKKKKSKEDEMDTIEKMNLKILQCCKFKEMSVIFDTNFDGWNKVSLNKNIVGRKNIMGIIFNGEKKAFGFVCRGSVKDGVWISDKSFGMFTINMNKPPDLQLMSYGIFSRNYDGKDVLYFASSEQDEEFLLFKITNMLCIFKGDDFSGKIRVEQNISKLFHGLDPKDISDSTYPSQFGVCTRIIIFQLEEPLG